MTGTIDHLKTVRLIWSRKHISNLLAFGSFFQMKLRMCSYLMNAMNQQHLGFDPLKYISSFAGNGFEPVVNNAKLAIFLEE